jgi:hypothetical protein
VEVALGHAVGLGGLEELLQVVNVGVNAAVRDKAHEMQTAGAGLGRLHESNEARVRRESALGDGGVDALEVLEVDAAGADGQVTDLGVAHDTVRQADGEAMRLDGRRQVLLRQRRHPWCLGAKHRVVLGGRRDAPAVDDDQNDLVRCRHLVSLFCTGEIRPASSKYGRVGYNVC